MIKILGIALAEIMFLSTFTAYAGDEWYLTYKKKMHILQSIKGYMIVKLNAHQIDIR